MSRQPRHALAARILSRLDQLAELTSTPGKITRLYLTREHRAAVELVTRWTEEAGLSVELDAAGTVVGRCEGKVSTARTLLIGSHIDTVRNAGRYDGCLGVVLAIEAMAELKRLGKVLPYAVEVLAFGDTEGVRFPGALTASRAVAGSLTADWLESTDADGITVAQALRSFGCQPQRIGDVARKSNDLLGYVEVHIEQGPVLEAEGLGIGVVTAISGASRFNIEVRGKAGHAGTQPMHMRKDALTGAAEMMLAVEQVGRATAGLVATVGEAIVFPGTANVVPGLVNLTLDIRSSVDRVRRQGVQEIERLMKAIARRRGLTVKLFESHDEKAVTCDQRLIRHFTTAAEAVGAPTIGLPSGAGHDGLAISKLCPVGMLFVRCKGGISHHPDEAVMAEDVEVATRVLLQFLSDLSPNGRNLS